MRTLFLVLVAICALIPAGITGLIIAAVVNTDTPIRMVAATAGAVVIYVGLFLLAFRSITPAFTVTTAGIDVRSMTRTVRIPWHDIAVVQLDSSFYLRGQAIVVRRDGTRIGSPVTAARYAIRRGESPYDHGPELLHPAIPVRVAIDAHQRYLRGELR